MSASDDIFETIAAKTSLAVSKKATKAKWVVFFLIKNNPNGDLAVKTPCWSNNLELDT